MKIGLEWRFIDSGISDGFTNMAVDEALLETQRQGLAPPTLRVYRWSPCALSLGYFQSLERDIDLSKCMCLGIDVVRRPTGGRAVLHLDELAYSVTAAERHGFPKSIAGAYILINSGLIAAYRLLGLETALVHKEAGLSSAACFAGAGSADLSCRGRKIAGSAQCRKEVCLLQHGSLPVSFYSHIFLSLLKFPTPFMRAKALAAITKEAGGISDILGRRIEWRDFKAAIGEGFREALGIVLRRDTLTPQEIALSRKLAREKYRTMAWNKHGKYDCEQKYGAGTENALLVP